MLEKKTRKRALKADEAGYAAAENACCIYFNDLTGPCRAFPYTQLISGELSQDQMQLSLVFSTGTVLIEGENLLDVFTLLCARRLVGVSVFIPNIMTDLLDRVSVNRILYSQNPVELN